MTSVCGPRVWSLLVPVWLVACASPPPEPTPPRVQAAPPPASSEPAPPVPAPIVEAPVVVGDPLAVMQQGLAGPGAGLVVSRGGTLAAVADGSRQIRLFDPRTAEERGVLQGHQGSLQGLDLAPEGDRLVSASTDGTARLWDLTSGAPPRIFFSGGLVYGARFSPDGTTMATVHEAVVKLWNKDGSARADLTAASAELAFSRDSALLVTWERAATSHKDIAVWDTATGALRYRLAGGNDLHREAAFSPDGSVLAWSRGDRVLSLSRATTGVVLRTISLPEVPGHLLFSPDGTRLAIEGKGAVHLWETTSGRRLAVIEGEGHGRFAFSPDSRRIAVQRGEHLALHDATTGRSLVVLPGGDSWVTAFAFAPDGKTLVGTAGIHAPELVVWNTQTGERHAALHRGSLEHRVAWTGDGKSLATLGARTGAPVARWDPLVHLWDAETGALRSLRRAPGARPLASDFHQLATSPDGTRVAASNMETVSLWDTASGRHVADLDQDQDFHTEHGVAFQPGGKLIATSGGKRGEIRLWDAATGKKSRVFLSKSTPAWELAFRPDGAVLAVGGPRDVELIDVRSGRPIRVLVPPHGGGVTAVAWAPDGKTLAVGSSKDSVLLLEAATGALLGELSSASGPARSLSFSAAGDLLAAGNDRLMAIWRVALSERLALRPGRDGEGAEAVAWHPRLPILAAARGSIELLCEPTAATVSLWTASAGLDLAGLALAEDHRFGGDPAAFAALRFRRGADLRAPLVLPSEVADTLLRGRLPGDLIAACVRGPAR